MKLLNVAMQRYWRVQRGLTLGVQCCVIDATDRVLLVRHTYRQGWHFPGGGVERRETLLDAVSRELAEEAGIVLDKEPELFRVYANFKGFPGDHIALFCARQWHQVTTPYPNREIAEAGFFPRTALPETLHASVRSRLEEIFDSANCQDHW